MRHTLHNLFVKKEALREQLRDTVAAEQQLKKATSQALSRRSFIKGLSATRALPLLQAMVPAIHQPLEASATPSANHHVTFCVDITPILAVEQKLNEFRSIKRLLKRQLKKTAQSISLILRQQAALDFIFQIVVIQIPWFLVHGCHPPAAPKPMNFGFFAPGVPAPTV